MGAVSSSLHTMYKVVKLCGPTSIFVYWQGDSQLALLGIRDTLSALSVHLLMPRQVAKRKSW